MRNFIFNISEIRISTIFLLTYVQDAFFRFHYTSMMTDASQSILFAINIILFLLMPSGTYYMSHCLRRKTKPWTVIIL